MGDLRRPAWLVAAAALVPLLLFLILQSGFGAREERRDIEARALSTSSALIVAADGEVKRHYAGLGALATARSLRRGDLAEFRSRAAELIGLNEGWRAAMLVDLANGAALAIVGDGRRKVEITSGEDPGLTPRFAGFATGPGCPCLMFHRLALAPAGERWAVRLLVSAEELHRLLPRSRGEYEVSAIVDDHGRFIARSLENDRRFGQAGSTSLRQAVRAGTQGGAYRGVTLEGLPNYAGFARSALTGWSAHVALASSTIDNPARRFAASLGVAALLSLLMASVLVAFAVRQITASRRFAERMQQAQKLEALGQLTGGIAHDFNNLLTPVIGAIDFVSRKPGLDPSSRRLLAGALSSAHRAGKLTTQLLAFSRRQKLTIEPIEVASMLSGMSDLLRQSIGDGHRLTIVQEDANLCVRSDLHQLELAILNLMLNARDASPEGSAIRLTVRGSGMPDEGEVALEVSDEGTGMDEATRQRALEPFFTTKDVGRGTGLGLAQVFGVASQSGGRLSIESSPGEGTRVILTLQRCSCAAPARPQRSEAPTDEARVLHLLVADDDPQVRATIVHALEDGGHVVDAVSDGPTALAALAQRSYAVVLVDYAMPEMTGAEVVRRAQQIRAGQAFLIVTGYADSDAVAGLDTPILRKPFAPDDLLEAVERLSSG